MKNPCEKIQYVSRKHTAACTAQHQSVQRDHRNTAMPRQEGRLLGANLWAAKGTTFSCSPNSLCWFNISQGLKEAVKFPDKRRTG